MYEIVQVFLRPEPGAITTTRVHAALRPRDLGAHVFGMFFGVNDRVRAAVAVLNLVMPTAREHAILIPPPIVTLDEATIGVFPEPAAIRAFHPSTDGHVCVVQLNP